MRLAQLSKLPEDPEPSSSLDACCMHIAFHPVTVTGITIRVRTSSVFLTQRSVEIFPQAFFYFMKLDYV